MMCGPWPGLSSNADSLRLDVVTIYTLCVVRLSRTHVMSLGIAEACQMPPGLSATTGNID